MNGQTKNIADCMYDVPLLASLQALLNNDSIRDQVYHI